MEFTGSKGGNVFAPELRAERAVICILSSRYFVFFDGNGSGGTDLVEEKQ